MNRGIVVAGFILFSLLIVWVLMTSNDGSGKTGNEAPREEQSKLINVDVNDPSAMAKWARGTCQGQTVESYAMLYGIEPTMDAVLSELSRDLPDAAKQIVVEVCKEELSKNED